MPNGDDKNKINHLEEIKKSLYSANPSALKKRREGRLREVFYGIPRDWAKETFKAPEKKFKLPPSLLKKFFIFSVAFFCLALAFVFFKFYRGANTISTENIEINVLGNSFIAGGEDLTMFEVDEAARIISNSADADANIIFGAVIRDELADQIRITVVATGFDETRARIAQIAQPRQQPQIQGVVSEGARDEDNEDNIGRKDYIEDGKDDVGDESSEDVFGEKFEIPAFLRKIT